MKESNATEVFFKASSTAALTMFLKKGKVPMSLTALVKNGKSFEFIPVGDESLGHVDARLAQPVLDFAVKPLVEHIVENDGAYTVAFFLSVAAKGGLKDMDTDEVEEATVIINAIRTNDKKGKTNTFKISDGRYDKLTPPEDDVWKDSVDESDIPSVLVQTLLDMVWKSFIVQKNMYSLNLTS